MCNHLLDEASAFGVLASHDPHHLEPCTGMDFLLVVGQLVLFGQCPQTDQELVGDLWEVVEDEGDASFHGVHERPTNVLELTEALFTDEVAEQTIELYGPVKPQLHVVRRIVFRKVVNCDQSHSLQCDVDLMVCPFDVSHLFIVDLALDCLFECDEFVDELANKPGVVLIGLFCYCTILIKVLPVPQLANCVDPQCFFVRVWPDVGCTAQSEGGAVKPRDESE